MIRNAAGWQAFKEGRSWLDSGLVEQVRDTGSGWRGVVRSGKRPMTVTVLVRSATDFEVRCPCPANQSAGTFCSHAVATGLAALKPSPSQPSTGSSQSGPSGSRTLQPKPVPAQAWPELEVRFPPNWRESLQRGRLSATVLALPEKATRTNEPALSAWLADQGATPKFPIHLQLDASRADALLTVLSNHPHLSEAKSHSPIAIDADGCRALLQSVHREDDEVVLTLDPALSGWIQLGNQWWHVSDHSISRSSSHELPPGLARSLVPLWKSGRTRMPVRDFLSSIDLLQDWLDFPPTGWLDALQFVPAPHTFRLSLDGGPDRLLALLEVLYDGESPLVPGCGTPQNLPNLSAQRCLLRDLTSEATAAARLDAAGFKPSANPAGGWQLTGERETLDFLGRIVPELRQHWEIQFSPRLQPHADQVHRVRPTIRVVGADHDWLAFDFSFQTDDGSEIPATEVRQWLASGKHPSRKVRGRSLVLDDDALEWIEPLFAELNLQQRHGRYETDARHGEIIRELQSVLEGRAKSDPICPPGREIPLPATVQATLRPYQLEGVHWLTDRCQRFGGALLADDMGLGKTLQTLCWAESLFSSRPDSRVLVVATASLLGNWEREWQKFAPARQVHILHGSGRDRLRAHIRPGQVVLTSYGTLARDLAWHLSQPYTAVVADEASLMRNPDTDHAKALVKLKAECKVALTGTPLENGVRDLWSIFRFIQPGWLGDRKHFQTHYEQPLSSGQARAVMQRLRLKTTPFLLRRTKEQVAPELPSKILIDEFCDLSREQQSVYQEFLTSGRREVDAAEDSGNPGAARVRMLAALLRLRQTCCDLALLGNERWGKLAIPQRSGKLQRLLELLEEAVSGGHRVLVFSQFQKQLLEIETLLQSAGIRTLRLDGQSRNRQSLVDQFQSPAGPPVFLISLKAGGYGLNLTAADTVIHYDPWWNPAAEAQATDRAHRIGQTRPVTVYRLLTRHTVEEKVVRLQSSKRSLADAISESPDQADQAVGWTLNELRELVQG